MINISIAGICVALDTDTPYILAQCKRFLTDQQPVLVARTTDAEIRQEQIIGDCTRAQAEFVCLHRSLVEQLISFDRLMLHSAAIQVNGKAYLFSAKSGTGKTTHIRLWKKCFGSQVQIINGDKPILWRKNGAWLACGTPWCGKEGWTSTACIPVAGLCFLVRSEENEIHPASKDEIVERVFHQIYRPSDPESLLQTMNLLDDFLASTPCWVMGCNISPDAAKIASEAMLGQNHNSF